jgi:hypothetical protein
VPWEIEKMTTYFDVVFDNFQESASVESNAVHNFSESGVAEGLRHTAGVDSAHRVVRSVLGVLFYSARDSVIPR